MFGALLSHKWHASGGNKKEKTEKERERKRKKKEKKEKERKKKEPPQQKIRVSITCSPQYYTAEQLQCSEHRIPFSPVSCIRNSGTKPVYRHGMFR